MAIGRTFKESFQKALRSLEIGSFGLDPIWDEQEDQAGIHDMASYLRVPGARRAWFIGDAFRQGFSLEAGFL